MALISMITPLNHEIQSEIVAYSLTPIQDGNAAIAFDAKARRDELDHEAIVIDRFQQSGAQRGMHGNRTTDDALGEFVDRVSDVHAARWSTSRARCGSTTYADSGRFCCDPGNTESGRRSRILREVTGQGQAGGHQDLAVAKHFQHPRVEPVRS